MDSRGQTVGAVIAIVAAGIALIMGVYVFNEVGGFTTDYNDHSYALSDTTFSENLENADTPWGTSDDNTVTSWDDTNEWAQIDNGGTAENLGESLITQSKTVTTHDRVDSASISASYQVPSADNANIDAAVLLRDPSGSEDLIDTDNIDNVSVSWTNFENTITDYVDEDGSYTLELRVTYDNVAENLGFEVNWDNASFDVTSQSTTKVHSIEEDLHDAYGMVPIVIVVLIASMIIGILIRFRR